MQFIKLTNKLAVCSWLSRQGAATAPCLAIDIETTGIDPLKDEIVSIQVANDSEAIFFSGEYADALGILKGFTLVLHNFRFDVNFLMRRGVRLLEHNLVRDTMLIHHLVDENSSHSLDTLVKHYFQDGYKDQFWAKYKTFAEAQEDDQVHYACKDALYTRKLYDILLPLAPSEKLIEHVHRLAYSLFETEYRGLAIDRPYTLAMGAKLQDEIEALRRRMRGYVEYACTDWEVRTHIEAVALRKTQRGKARVPYEEFNFDSQAQLCWLLYEALQLPVQTVKDKKTRMLRRTVDDNALERLEQSHPVIGLLRDYRAKRKLYTAFIEGTLDHAVNGRVYPSFNVNGTVTGRISSSEPNLQQLPREGEVRGIYIPDPGHVFLSCDYSQLEVTIAAHFSQDPNLLKIVNEGASKHDITASALGIERHLAKTLNFAMQYQCSPYKVGELLKVDMARAAAIWRKYWETYKGEKRVIDVCKRYVEEGKPIRNPFGRLRHFPDLKAARDAARVAARVTQGEYQDPYPHGQVEAFYRQAYSSLIQGTGADLTSRAFYLTAEEMKARDLGVALFTVHDEIMLMPKIECFEEAKSLLIQNMVGVGEEVGLRVPLKVDCSEAMQRWEK